MTETTGYLSNHPKSHLKLWSKQLWLRPRVTDRPFSEAGNFSKPSYPVCSLPLQVPPKLENWPMAHSSHSWALTNNLHALLQKCLCARVYCCTSHKSKDMEPEQMSIHRRMDDANVVYLYTERSSSSLQTKLWAVFRKMDRPGKYNITQGAPKHVLCHIPVTAGNVFMRMCKRNRYI